MGVTTLPCPYTLATAIRHMGHAVTTEQATCLADEIARYGSVDALILTLAHDESGRTLALLNAWRAFQAEETNPSLRIARLQREAVSLDHRAEPAWADAAEMAGKAAARRLRGEPDLAEAFENRALAAERVAAALEQDAFAKRLEAARLQTSADFAEVLRDREPLRAA